MQGHIQREQSQDVSDHLPSQAPVWRRGGGAFKGTHLEVLAEGFVPLSNFAAAVSRFLSDDVVACRYTDQVDVEGEFTKGVLTMVAKYSKPEMASRLAHSPGQVGLTS